jgi:hypothetical protein
MKSVQLYNKTSMSVSEVMFFINEQDDYEVVGFFIKD